MMKNNSVLLHNNRRHISSIAIIPFHGSGGGSGSSRALPSKWDDADRWITSPVSGNNAAAFRTQCHHKSKSHQLRQGPKSQSRSFVAASPLTTGVVVPHRISLHCGSGGGGMGIHARIYHNSGPRDDNAAGWTELLSDSSPPTSTDNEKLGDSEGPEKEKSHIESRRGMATNMSSGASQSGQLSSAVAPPMVPLPEDQHSNYSAELKVRDVEVDKRVTVTSQSRKDGARMSKKRSPDVKDIISSWHVAEASKTTLKLSKQEARIAAWENLQKAKAEAAIKRLEMKLEKKRTASMDRILNKLSTAQTKARDLRESVSDNHANDVPRSKPKDVPTRRMGSLGGCFRGLL